VLARLFALTRPALMRIAWFARGFARWTAWKTELLTRVRASAVWRAAAAVRLQVAAVIRRWR
jgi:hypothetical protein